MKDSKRGNIKEEEDSPAISVQISHAWTLVCLAKPGNVTGRDVEAYVMAPSSAVMYVYECFPNIFTL
jgi:hypothetical protein